jgi:hypothetical protein
MIAPFHGFCRTSALLRQAGENARKQGSSFARYVPVQSAPKQRQELRSLLQEAIG